MTEPINGFPTRRTVERIYLRDFGIVSRILGWHWIARRSNYAILYVPWWVPRSVRDRALEHVVRDFQIRYARKLCITSGSRLVRFDW